jgi:RNA polymerase sigma factor (sigma-70 family)
VAELSEADRYLLEQIAKGNADGWTQLVDRYQGRLLAFARGRLQRKSEAEDLVQDTFVTFLQAIGKFREGASVETFLFTILRRKIIDFFRGRQMRVCFIQDVLDDRSGSGDSSGAEVLPSPQETASWYLRRDEQSEQLRDALAAGLGEFLDKLKAASNFRDLRIIEMLLYAQLRNKEAAKLAGIDEKHVALIKHRAMKEIAAAVARHVRDPSMLSGWAESMPAESALTDTWEQRRLSCPKRSTLGRFLLGTLDPEWKQYVEFHAQTLGCAFCRANLDDLQKQTNAEPRGFRERVMQSTIGFFKPSQG